MKPLIEHFNFTKRIVFEELEHGHEVIAMTDKTIIRTDDVSAAKDMAELFSLAKMGEADPLLCTFFFQKEYTEKDASYMQMFHQLCQPLQDGWAWKVMRRHAPDIYEREISETYEMFRAIYDMESPVCIDKSNRRIMLSLFCIIYENPVNKVDLGIKTDDLNKKDWDNYIAALKRALRQEPDTKHYLALPKITNAAYTVGIDKQNNNYIVHAV